MIRIALTLMIAASLTGCATTQTVEQSPAGVPAPFELTFQSRRSDNRAVYYELARDRSLGFGGGPDGKYAVARPIGDLTDEQVRELWTIICDHDLLNVKSESVFAKWQAVRYDVKIKAGSDSASYTVHDPQSPGIEALEKKLFEIQGDLRYGDLFRPIDEAIRKGDGSVKKR